jgi:hypothetical protein
LIHPLVTQLRFARSEFVRGLEGVSDAEGQRRFPPMNSLSWIVGHLANQEQAYWVLWPQGRIPIPDLNGQVGSGKPATTPPLDAMWSAWHTITAAADSYLETVTDEVLDTHFEWKGRTIGESVGTLLLRNTYHYWYHLGEASAIRQWLGHEDLPQFVGDMGQVAYRMAT